MTDFEKAMTVMGELFAKDCLYKCYIKIELDHGFFYKDGTGYRVDFMNKKVEAFPFIFDIVIPG
ncbi:MAG: hypothetical protein K0R90_1187 [Oscillospiraceae bacterium]|nr:hypothetical protein [Oscillospiraceae bacterium]